MKLVSEKRLQQCLQTKNTSFYSYILPKIHSYFCISYKFVKFIDRAKFIQMYKICIKKITKL